MYFKTTRAAVTVAGGAAALCLGSIPAALAAPASSAVLVPCSPVALHAALADPGPGETLDLAPGCTYSLPGSLPEITTDLTIVGYQSTLTRAPHAGGFSLLTVGGLGCKGGIGGGGVNIPAGNANLNPDDLCKADLTVINVNFTDGGGYDVGTGGAIDNDGGTLHVTGGTFSDNESNNEAGAIYNDGHMTVNNGTFTDNLAHYGGAIYNDGVASIGGSSFTWNNAPTSDIAMRYNSYGGAIYNQADLHLANSGFVGNSTGGYGGAIYTKDTLDAAHITVTANAAAFGGGIYKFAGTATVFGSVVFGNQPDNCVHVTGC
jgi:predicted outer membrane repeat protein